MADQVEEERIELELHRQSGGTDPFLAAVRATRMPMLITDPTQPDNPIVFVNDAFGHLTGYSRSETLGRNCRFLQGPGTNTDDVARIHEAVRKREAIELDLLNYRKDGTTFWNRLLISPVFDNGELTYFFASQFDITPERERLGRLSADGDGLEEEISRRVGDLMASEDRLKFTLAAGRLGAWTLNIGNKRLLASSLFKVNFGRSSTDRFTYQDLRSSVHEDDAERWEQKFADALQGSGDFDLEFRIVTPAGQLRWMEVRAQTRFDADGKPISMAGLSQDISDRKEAETHRDLLTKELNHRVKNTLATVQSIVTQSLRGEDVPPAVAEVIAQRLHALAGAHDVLTNRGWEAARLSEIVAAAIWPFDTGNGARIRTSGDEVIVSARAATAFVLALHELATNEVKYGALSNESGTVSVAWHVHGETFELTWTETGGPAVKQPMRRGFGSKMIEQALAASILGVASIEYLESGVHFVMTTDRGNLTETSSQEQ
ncbi:PAS domain S-box-containing protein [Devosia sp. UYZn731]|uniref:PAS domain-containing protein n=1 Tax=Devosia sp. UYZn731 TaxID=3156345 RepID=UPI003394C5E3